MDDKLPIDFLEISEIDGNKKCKIIEIYGAKCRVTDYAILLGCKVSEDEYVGEIKDYKNRVGLYGTKTRISKGWKDYMAHADYSDAFSGVTGIRPITSYKRLAETMHCYKTERFGDLIEAMYCEQPRNIVDDTTGQALEELYSNGELSSTGKVYLSYFNQKFCDNNYTKHVEYTYGNEKYIRMVCKNTFFSDGRILSNGKEAEVNKPYWIKVEPIIWLIDEEHDMALTKEIIDAGVIYGHGKSFDKTIIYKYSNTCLVENMRPSQPYLIIKDLPETFEKAKALKAVKQAGMSLQTLTNFQNDADVVFAAVTQNGMALQFAHASLRGKLKIVLAAVMQDGMALQFASKTMRDNETVVFTAIRQNSEAFKYASVRLRKLYKNYEKTEQEDESKILEQVEASILESETTTYEYAAENSKRNIFSRIASKIPFGKKEPKPTQMQLLNDDELDDLEFQIMGVDDDVKRARLLRQLESARKHYYKNHGVINNDINSELPDLRHRDMIKEITDDLNSNTKKSNRL